MSSQLSALLCVGDRARAALLSRGAGLEESRAAFRRAFAGEREQEAALRGDFAVQLYSEQWGSFVDAGPEMSIEAPCRLRAVPLSGGRQTPRLLGLLEPHSSAFFCCDMQERFRPAIKFFGEIALVAQRLIEGARELDVPVVVTEQYPKGLGNSVPELNLAGARAVIPKTRFSMLVPEVEALLLGELGAVRSVVLFGVETHVCIQQTALELTARGYEVHVVGDATSSRSQTDRLLALQRLSRAGVIVTTSEAVLLQLVADKNHPKFRAVQALIKTSAPETGGRGAMKSLPYWCRGKVVKGFGRGSKQLGIPTANLPESVVEQLPADVATGIYFGWACVGSGDVHKMVMSIGWNPFYNNTKKSMEVHIIHSFEEDFYGEVLSIVILGYIRAETGFDSLDDLIDAIHNDIRTASSQLDLAEYKTYQQENFFRHPDLKKPSIPSA